MKNLMKMNDVVDVVCSGDGIVLPSEPTTNFVNLF